MEKLGVTIRKIRNELALKVYELAKEVGVSSVYITQIEKHGKLPSPAVMKKISEVLCDEQLFDIYLKMKYPVVYGTASKREVDSEFKQINKAFEKKNIFLVEAKKLQRCVVRLKVNVDVSMEELKKIINVLEKIEKSIN